MELVQVAQHADDLDRASAFYTRLLGVTPSATFDPPGLVFFRVGPVRLLLERGAPSALLYVEVPDARDAAEQCRLDGIEVLSKPHVIFRHTDDMLGPAGTDEWMAFIRDSEGNMVGLVSHQPIGPGGQ